MPTQKWHQVQHPYVSRLGKLQETELANATFKSEDYFLNDYRQTFFPLSLTELLVKNFSEKLSDFIYQKVLNTSVIDCHFLPQQRCYAAKRGFHLRRTVKLDPIAEYFIYDIVYRNRSSFRRDHRAHRRSFGYRFAEGKPESPTAAYGAFKSAVAYGNAQYSVNLRLDVATYFNCIYHHDLINSVRGLGWAEPDVESIGLFLREINVGRSIDCLPHGLHPCKVLGSEFLRFVDNSYRIRSELTVRFLDDIHLFDDSNTNVMSDLLTVQELLGEKGLSLNESKTSAERPQLDVNQAVDTIKAELLQVRRQLLIVSGDIEGEILEHDDVPLTEQQTEYLVSLLHNPEIEESDAELVLALLRDSGEKVLPRMMDFLHRFPGLTKSVYNFTRFSSDVSSLDGLDLLTLDFLRDSVLATEYQLFWLVKLAEDYLSKSPRYGEILMAAFNHPNATPLSKSKVLEIPDRRFGLPELRSERLRSGRSDWEAWAAAAGTISEPPSNRNHVLSYFGNASQMNWLIADCLRSYSST